METKQRIGKMNSEKKAGGFGDYLERERRSDPDAMSCVYVSVFFWVLRAAWFFEHGRVLCHVQNVLDFLGG